MAKTKKEIILELKQANPKLTPEEAAEQVPCTLAYAKRILTAEAVAMEGEIATIGKEIGVAEDQLKEWCDWIRSSLKAPSALDRFKEHLIYKEALSKRGE